MRFAAVLLCVAGLLLAVEREGNFDIRFQPTAILQTKVEVPFEIDVKDALGKPLINAMVTLQIEMPNHSQVKVFRAPAVSPGVYIAKPIFPVSGQWSVYVEAHRDNEMSARTIQFNVPE